MKRFLRSKQVRKWFRTFANVTQRKCMNFIRCTLLYHIKSISIDFAAAKHSSTHPHTHNINRVLMYLLCDLETTYSVWFFGHMVCWWYSIYMKNINARDGFIAIKRTLKSRSTIAIQSFCYMTLDLFWNWEQRKRRRKTIAKMLQNVLGPKTLSMLSFSWNV